jgi:hypothetical protein
LLHNLPVLELVASVNPHTLAAFSVLVPYGEVLDVIVCTVPVDMPHHLVGFQRSSEVPCHHKPVFEHQLSGYGYIPISVGVDVPISSAGAQTAQRITVTLPCRIVLLAEPLGVVQCRTVGHCTPFAPGYYG